MSLYGVPRYRISRAISTFLRSLPRRCKHTSPDKVPHVAIIGSGPAGFYTAQQLLKGHPSVRVDIFEKLPVPFGLVRFGVAPDHPEVKNVINTFTQTAEKDRCSFLGNVTIGKDITVSELQKNYTAVVLSYGADADRTLGIPGEDLPNVLSARRFVGWYNGLPEDKELPVDLSCDSAVVLGHGNVALDVARILLTPLDILKKTDISEHALASLAESRVKQVHLVGRRGPLQVAFTIKELREMVNLPECRTVINPQDVASLKELINDLPRPRKRLTDLLYRSGCEPAEKDVKRWADAVRQWNLHFCLSPQEVAASADGKGPERVKFAVNRLEGPDLVNQKAVATDAVTDITCGLVLRSIGYKSIPIDSTVPFDADKGIIPNKNSRVQGTKGLYCSGWVGRGPVGVILNTMTDGFDTGKVILKDMEEGQLETTGKQGHAEVKDILTQRGVEIVTFSDWEKINTSESEAGKKIGKPREKITDVPSMLGVVKSKPS
ncbi:NADPH:adrenodoxin oxidoreductase, mitochondrial-like isoform X2 [Haliotis rubra]|nr:NADPH:adrenodoxin oxidoreductase, mitochondrial-like isoform X2 [Haliotis rubra]XP_046549988.1 NADPH:adrenodoxin oxidoreductase, mitochondrial-like isoform X2 [Haliotis rubra]XP_046549989.1 NADPH:adrenodoxin oxidoreductase, mitochondrial-like isoform X2 [Haliotis rubra]XP_046549990.1 NADPH:adrenodoxin oxidoreductase, mitochondrial-like isoform X2 [Haliotis rubra]